MQDAERLQEQVDEIITKAEARAEVAKSHHEAVVSQRHAANRELSKFKFLHEVFTFGHNLLNQRKTALLDNEEDPPEAHVVEGLDAALDELGRISRQAQDATHRFDGSQTALKSLEEAFREEQMHATSRARGLAVQGQRAVDVAASRTGEIAEDTETTTVSEKPAEAPAEALEAPEQPRPITKSDDAGGSAKEPIASP